MARTLRPYLLKRVDEHVDYDEAAGFVVLAHDADEARSLASEQAWDEGADTWLNGDRTTCEVLEPTGGARVVLRDQRAR
jgi:hypothetical protein